MTDTRPPRVPSAPLPEGTLTQLDWLRGIAALAVLVGHVRGLFFVDYSDLAQPSVVARLAYMVSGLGHQAVVVFFVLSGFFIAYSVLSARQRGAFDAVDYGVRRASRIYTVLVPALLVTLLVDHLGIAIFGTSRTIYGGEVNAQFLDLPVIPEILGMGVLLGNLLQLQDVTSVSEFGTNGPLWSLPYEAWAYLMFPLGLAAFSRPVTVRSVAGGALCVALLAVANATLYLYLPVWLLGAVVARWWVGRDRSADIAKGSPWVAAVALLVFAALIVVARGRLLDSRWLEDVLLGVSTAVLIAALLSLPQAWTPRRSAKAATWLAGFSFSMYLFHYPMVAFLHAWLLGPDRWVPTPASVGAGVGLVIGIAMLWCYPLYWVTERHTPRVRAWFAARIKASGSTR